MDDRSSNAERRPWRALLPALVGIAVCAVCFANRPETLFRGYLVAYIFCLGPLLGCLALAMLYRLTGGGWGRMVLRALEAAARLLPMAALLFVPILLGMRELYPWTDRSIVAADAALAHKSGYLNQPAFEMRALCYFVIWLTLAFLLDRWSRRYERTGEPSLARPLGVLSGPGLVLVGLADTFAGIDWQMSLEPNWFSTMFPVVFAIGQLLAGMALAILAVTAIAPHPDLRRPEGKADLQDLGNLLLTFVILWAYVAFAQFLLIWSGNLPEETRWYLPRFAGGWRWLAIGLAACEFGLPLLLLLSRAVKRDYRALAFTAALILALHFVDVFWQVMPAFRESSATGQALDFLVAIGATLAIGGLCLAAMGRQLRAHRPIPLIEERVEPDVHE